MRFRSFHKAPSYTSRAFQLRMIMLIVSLGVVIFAIKVTSNPAFWAKMFPDDPAAEQAGKSGDASGNQTETQPGLDGIPKVQLDEVLIAGISESEDPETPTAEGTEAGGGTETAVESTLPILPDLPEVAGLQIDPDRFQSLEDYSVGVRPNEYDAFFYTIYHASRIPLEELAKAADRNVTHTAMRGKPEYYRGKVIGIEGELRRLERIVASQNAYGIEEFYNAWIITPTSDNIPFRVVARFKDDSLPVRQVIEELLPVRVSGYFFKIESYATQEGKAQMTPVLIARRITAVPEQPASIALSENSHPGRWLFVIFSAVFVIAIWSAYRSTVGAARMRAQRKEMLESDGDLSELQGQASINPGEELRKMADNE